MEVIIGSAGNVVFLDWLDYIRDQIAGRPSANKASCWYTRRMRYVFETTGPYSMNRFLKLRSNATTLKSVGFLECNYFKDADALSNVQKRVYDVISYQSQSYFTKEHSIRVPVGRGDAVLPRFPSTATFPSTARRMRWKSSAVRTLVSTDASDTTVPCLCDTEAFSQEACMLPLDAGDEITPTIEAALDVTTNLTVDYVVDVSNSGVAGLIEFHADRCRTNQLRAHLRVYTALDHMPDELKKWLTTDLANIAFQQM